MELYSQNFDFTSHNEEVHQVWEAYRAGNPTRVPVIFGTNSRFTLLRFDANPQGITFQKYFNDPQVMLQRQLEHQEWVRRFVPQDAEMGLPRDGWHVFVDLQNVYEAAWFGCEVEYCEGQVPDTIPLLNDDNKNLLFDRGIPDPFTGGMMARNWEFYEYFVEQQKRGFTYRGLPILSVTPGAMNTDGPLTSACNLRGTDFLLDLAADPEYAIQLLTFITDATIARLTAYRKRMGLPLKSPGWGFADDALQLISTTMLEEMILPHYRRLVSAFSSGGPLGLHLCGDATRHFSLLKEKLNIGSFDTGYPVDFGWLREQLGPEVEIYGGPSVPFLQAADEYETGEEVRRILQSGIMEGGRFVMREGNNLSPDIPLENLWAMYDAVREYGRYENGVPAYHAELVA